MSKLKENRKKALLDNDWDMVIKYGEMEIEKEPQSIKVLNDLSFAYFKKQDYDQALICCDKIHEVIPTEDLKVLSEKYGIHYMRYNEVLGEIYYLQGRDEDALKVFDRLKVLGPILFKKVQLICQDLNQAEGSQRCRKRIRRHACSLPSPFQNGNQWLA